MAWRKTAKESARTGRVQQRSTPGAWEAQLPELAVEAVGNPLPLPRLVAGGVDSRVGRRGGDNGLAAEGGDNGWPLRGVDRPVPQFPGWATLPVGAPAPAGVAAARPVQVAAARPVRVAAARAGRSGCGRPGDLREGGHRARRVDGARNPPGHRARRRHGARRAATAPGGCMVPEGRRPCPATAWDPKEARRTRRVRRPTWTGPTAAGTAGTPPRRRSGARPGGRGRGGRGRGGPGCRRRPRWG